MKNKIQAHKPIFYPENFSPEIWETTHDGKTLRLLVCAKSWVHSPFTENSCERLTHPVAIVLSVPATVIYALADDCHEWRCFAPEDAGISRVNAQKALAQAWRGVKAVTATSWQTQTHRFHFKAGLAVCGDVNASTQEKTMLCNLNVYLRWDDWQRRGLSRAEASRELTESGFPATAKELNKIAENLELC
jgi:hypothetical protein